MTTIGCSGNTETLGDASIERRSYDVYKNNQPCRNVYVRVYAFTKKKERERQREDRVENKAI